MLTTKDVKLKGGRAKGLKPMTTSNTKPRTQPSPDPKAASEGVSTRKTRGISGPMLTTENSEERKRTQKRAEVAAAKKAARIAALEVESLSDLPELEGVEYVTVEGEDRPIIPSSGNPSSVRLRGA
jgi:hypothetical protein